VGHTGGALATALNRHRILLEASFNQRGDDSGGVYLSALLVSAIVDFSASAV
jgi:hypothetical protein